MKKFLFTLMIATASVTAANAQFTNIGGGVAAGTGIYFNKETDNSNFKSGLPAFFIAGIYEITLPIQVAPSYTYYFPHITKTTMVNEESSRQVISCMMFDLNGHFILNSLNRFEFYGLAGLNVTLLTSKWIVEISGMTFKSKENDNAFGLNLGAGTYIKLTGQIDLCGEAKYILSRYGQIVVNVGILFNPDWLIRHEEPGD